MKCKVCGFQFESDRSYCPMCGARAKDVEMSPDEMQWNTKDFPKPKDIQDIPMRWSSPDASEGYFTAPTFTEKKTAEAEKARAAALSEAEFFDDLDKEFVIEAPTRNNSFVNASRTESNNSYLNTSRPEPKDPFAFSERNTLPFESKALNTKASEKSDDGFIDMNHTFSVDKDKFQRELDKEFERLRDVQKEDDFVPPQGFSAPAGFGPAFDTAKPKSSTFQVRNTGAFIDLTASNSTQQRKPASTPRQDRFDIDAIEDTIEEIVAAEAKAQAESTERKRKLAAMAAARDAYFKSLDDGEFDSGLKKRNPKYDPKNQNSSYIAPQPDICLPREDNVRMETDPKVPEADNTTIDQDPVAETLNLNELTGPLQDDEEHTMKFDKEEFLAAATAKLEAEREAREYARLEEQAKLEMNRQEREDAWIETLKQAEAEEARRKAEYEAEQEKLRAERQAQEEARLEAERLAEEARVEAKRQEEEQARLEAERLAAEEAERKIKDEIAKKAKEEADRKAKEEADKKILEEAIRKAQMDAEAKAQQEAAQRVAEIEAQIQAKIAEEEEKRAAERQAQIKEQTEKLEAERQAILADAKTKLDEERAARIEAEKKLEEERIAAQLAEEKRNIELVQKQIKEKEKEKQRTQDFSELFKMSNEIGKAINPIEAPDILGKDNNEAEIVLDLSATGDDEEMRRQREIEDHPLYTMKQEAPTKLSDLVPERGNHEINTDDTQHFESVSFDVAAPKTSADALDDLYSEDGKAEKKHRVLPIILFSVIILIAVIELAIFVLGKFMPEQAFVVTLTEINSAVLQTISDFFKTVGNGIGTWVKAAVARVQGIFKSR